MLRVRGSGREIPSRTSAWRRAQLEARLKLLRVPWEGGHVDIRVDRKDFLTSVATASLFLKLVPCLLPSRGLGVGPLKIDFSVLRTAQALDALPRDSRDWRKIWRFSFKGEPARDAGGVAREFWTLLSEQLFHPHAGLFMYSATDNLCYQINPLAPSLHGADTSARLFRVTGRLLGKALLDRQLMTVSLNRPLLKHALALPVALSDLEQVDAALHQNLKWMLTNDQAQNELLRLFPHLP
jgi:hypothetical protein